MEYFEKYWSQIALILTIIAGIVKFYFDARTKKDEIRYTQIIQFKMNLAREYIEAYTTIHTKINKVSNHLFFGSWEDESLLPILEEYNTASSKFNSAAQLTRFAFNNEINTKIDQLIRILRETTQKINLYVNYRRSSNVKSKDVSSKISDDYSLAVSENIPNVIPVLGEEIIKLIGIELNLK